MTAAEDLLFKEEMLETEGNAFLSKMTRKELDRFLDEIRDNISSNASFASELQYWQTLSRKVRQKIATKQIEGIYKLFLRKNKERIEQELADQKAREELEENKGAQNRIRKTLVRLSLAEKIKKTALNTGIRFNIVDNYGFDNASIQMFQEAQKQGMNADE